MSSQPNKFLLYLWSSKPRFVLPSSFNPLPVKKPNPHMRDLTATKMTCRPKPMDFWSFCLHHNLAAQGHLIYIVSQELARVTYIQQISDFWVLIKPSAHRPLARHAVACQKRQINGQTIILEHILSRPHNSAVQRTGRTRKRMDTRDRSGGDAFAGSTQFRFW